MDMTANCTAARTNSRLLIVFSFSLLLAAASFAVGISAGTDISAESEVTINGEPIVVTTPAVRVQQVYGLGFVSGEVSAEMTAGETFYSPCTVINNGNGSDLLSFSLAGTTPRFVSTLIQDDDGNGRPSSSEATPVPVSLPLAEDAIYNFFVALTSPLDATVGLQGKTSLTVESCTIDACPYVGATGITYGGWGTQKTAVNLTVSSQHDTTPPTIKSLTINKKQRFSSDIISSNLQLEAIIVDNIPDNIDRVILWMKVFEWNRATSTRPQTEEKGEILAMSGGPENHAGFQSNETTFRYVSPSPLSAGSYTFMLEAWDKSQNSTSETLSDLKVESSDKIEIIGSALNYPNPFSPLKGEIATIAYTLNVDATVSIYLFDLRGSTIWKRTYSAGFEGGLAGYNEVPFNGQSDFGEIPGNGIYLYEIIFQGKVIGKGKMTILDAK